MTRRSVRPVALVSVLVCAGAVGVLAVQSDEKEIRGAAILEHPAGKLAVQAAELLTAGRIDDYTRLRSAEDQADWKKASAVDRKDMSARFQKRAPDPRKLAEEIRKAGILTIGPAAALLDAPYGSGSVKTMLALEGDRWRVSVGPMVLEDEPASDPASETRLRGAEIERHPVYEVALRYADAVHAGKGGSLVTLMSSKGQEVWRSAPASERAESLKYRKGNVPKRSDMAAGIRDGGVLIIEDDKAATLNIITVESTSTQPGQVTSTSTTVVIPFVFEDGAWKLAR